MMNDLKLTEVECAIATDLTKYTKRVKGAKALSQAEQGECIKLAKEIAAKIESVVRTPTWELIGLQEPPADESEPPSPQTEAGEIHESAGQSVTKLCPCGCGVPMGLHDPLNEEKTDA